MGQEIERKFLVDQKLWRPASSGTRYSQGYLSVDVNRTVRIRVAGERAFLTVKGRNVGFARPEYEYGIPLSDAIGMLELCDKPYISKTRYEEFFAGNKWEIDVFHDANDGLVLAEIEIPSESYFFEKPKWATEDVSQDARYYNSSLLKAPFSEW